MGIQFDHFITYTSAENIDEYLREYATQGFTPEEKTVRHDPGLRNGFVFFGPEYIEFCWVEDETLFTTADAEEKAFRSASRPFGIGMASDDVQVVHEDWTARGYSVPEVWSKAPRDAAPDTAPLWSFQEIPSELLPGVSCFALTYHARPKDKVKRIKIPPNTIYAISGLTFVSIEAATRATQWRNLLAPGQQVNRSKISLDVWVGPHLARWMTPDAYEAYYGIKWTPSSHPAGELALIHLLASDLGTAKKKMEQSGRRTFPIVTGGEGALLIAPDPRDGFTFLVRQLPVEVWLQERISKTGENLKLDLDQE